MQTQLTEHLQESEGISHQATIDWPFSDERILSPAERDAENAAFLSRVRAATHEVKAVPSFMHVWGGPLFTMSLAVHHAVASPYHS